MALTIFNCPDSGYGPDPNNATQGVDVSICNANAGLFKCRIQYGIANIIQKRANNTLVFE